MDPQALRLGQPKIEQVDGDLSERCPNCSNGITIPPKGKMTLEKCVDCMGTGLHPMPLSEFRGEKGKHTSVVYRITVPVWRYASNEKS